MAFVLRILRLVLLGVLIYVLYKILWKGDWFPSLFSKNSKRRNNSPTGGPIEQMKRDPVCGTFIPENQAIKYKNGKETLYFCSEECKQTYLFEKR
jgi:YHS domain-containing protein